MGTATSKATNEAQIRGLIDNRVAAVRAKDIGAATADIAPDIVQFDVVNPLQYAGSDALRKRAEQWFSTFEGSIGFEIRDLTIVAGDDVAFSHSLNHVNGIRTDGNKLDMWWRSTVCYRKIGGRWLIAHEHNSAPFDPETGKASLDLKP